MANNCFIGTNVTVLPGVTLGDNTIVGASVARGSCARIITCAVTLVLASRFIFDSFDLGTDKLIFDNTTSKF